jgi:chaperone modulatory protein CbpM
MTDKVPDAIPAEIIDTASVYSLEELSHTCDVEVAWIIELIEQGVIEPRGGTASEWRFSSLSIVRLAKAKRFDRDLGVNPAGIALAFDLLNEIDRLKAHLNVLKSPRSSLAGESDEHRDSA